MGYTLAEKILMFNAQVESCKPGDIVITKPNMVMFHDIYTPFVYEKFKEMGFTKVWDTDKVAIMLDHLLPTCLNDDPRHLRYGYKFAEEFGVENFHAADGISHQLMPELRYAKPGDVVYVTDSHTTTYGAVGCFSTGIGYTEMASILGTGELWARVPSAIKIQIDGDLPEGVYAKDIILRILGDIKADGGTYKSLEFCGTTIDALSIDSRLTIANMVVECGGKVGLFAADRKTAEYSGVDFEDVKWICFDEDAEYEKVLHYHAEEFVPYIACPPYVDNVHPITNVKDVEVDEVFIGSCTNGRLEDLAIAAQILEGKKVSKFVKFIVTPASRKVFKQAIDAGYIETLVKAGAMVTHPYCSLCQGRSSGLMAENEVLLGTNNRNFLGRMGSAKAKTYLSSPAVAAASAIIGKITDPKMLDINKRNKKNRGENDMAQNGASVTNQKAPIKIMGIDIIYFLVFATLVLALTYMNKLPVGMAGAVPLLMVLGAVFGFIGDRLPIIKDFFGGGAIVILFGSSALVLFQILPKPAIDLVSFFMNKTGFIDFALAVLITGSLFGTDRKTLLGACLRYVPCIMAAQIVGLAVVGAIGTLIGYGFKESILYIGLPAMGGGIAAGAIPMSKMFGEAMKQDPKIIFSTMVSAVALANAMAILGGGLMDRIGKVKPEWTGNGKLLAVKTDKKMDEEDREDSPADVKQYGVGILVSLCILFAGYLAMKFVPAIHAYAWMVIIAVLVKLSGVLPVSVEDAAHHWCQLCVKNFLGLLLAGLGIALVDLGAVLKALSLNYVLLVGAVVVSTAFAAAFVGRLIGFHPIEAGITVGLCSTDMGGSGDLAILSASKRMELLPFAAISTRIGGAIILILSGFLLTVLL